MINNRAGTAKAMAVYSQCGRFHMNPPFEINLLDAAC